LQKLNTIENTIAVVFKQAQLGGELEKAYSLRA